MFATIPATDVNATVSWYVDGLGFVVLFTMPGTAATDQPLLVHLRRWQFQDLLICPATQRVHPADGMTLSFAAAYDEIDTLSERAASHGGGQVDNPIDTPWNTRDVTTADPDGNVVIFTAARPPSGADEEFNNRIRRWSREQGLQPPE